MRRLAQWDCVVKPLSLSYGINERKSQLKCIGEESLGKQRMFSLLGKQTPRWKNSERTKIQNSGNSFSVWMNEGALCFVFWMIAWESFYWFMGLYSQYVYKIAFRLFTYLHSVAFRKFSYLLWSISFLEIYI